MNTNYQNDELSLLDRISMLGEELARTPVVKPISREEEEAATRATAATGMFTILSANEWMEKSKNEIAPRQLLNELLHEGEVCILFADTGMGKSIFAVQAGEHISGGASMHGFRGCPPQPVLYIDFELSEKQREIRYSESNESTGKRMNHYRFSYSLFFAQIDPAQEPPQGYSGSEFEQWLKYSIEKAILDTGAKVIIVDNITYLSAEQEKARDALPLMKELKELKNKYGLTILCLAHTPKRDNTKPLHKNDLQGSKMLINFCDSAFAIGESITEKSIRYIKQIKARNTEMIYDTNNVMVFEVKKPGNFLHFEFKWFAKEMLHLETPKDKRDIEAEILKLRAEDKSYGEIAETLGTNRMKVKRTLDKCQGTDQLFIPDTLNPF